MVETQVSWKKLNREQRGRLIYQNFRIVRTTYGWRVPSQSGKQPYLVKFNGHTPTCECPDCRIRKEKCKHIYAVEFYLKRQIHESGKITQTKGVRITYSQDWPKYDRAQTNEKIMFMKILNELCATIKQPKYKFGRPKLPISDMVFSSALKVYSTFSLRRFMSDVKIAKEMSLVDKVPCYASVGHFMQREDLTPILKNLIKLSALPLSSVETDFAVDSSGFSTSRFARWFDHKWGREQKYRIWLKAHLISGVKTNIVTSVEITEGHVNDSPQLTSLVNETAKQFEMKEVSCDRAYSSRENLQLISEVGAVPYIPFKSNVSGKRAKHAIWRKMYHLFMYKHEEFLEHYHKRSNAETVFHMLKSKFGDGLRSKTGTSQVNELLCKILCHNICVLVYELEGLGGNYKYDK